ncbi:MAG: AmmeMemoRadiSam system protein B [Proteobacteria bacterium]|nr:AmmeMemoRadiSam system protein B [Pseudomonadota bacterium]MBU1650439.1 AmmeMemoRadiSam system protein B [Pseudomonadota bacterium]MBU1986064.1 AmmeMemoRadiSam system protein B [Pseudomonadota bacterium]
MHTIIRRPAVADRFYPGNPDILSREIQELTQSATPAQKAHAVVSPHAGYMYSGAVAGETFAQVRVPETVIILGPNHHGQGAPIALSTTPWQMPMGLVPIDTTIADALLKTCSVITVDETAHRFEHSLEVQVPFLQARQKNLSIVPLVVSHISYPLCLEVGTAIAKVIAESGKEILIVASSDMTHYEPRTAADKKDHYALKKLADMDPSTLYHAILDYNISMCGIMPVTIALIAAKALGATKTELVRYTDSGDVSGDTSQVVGYAGVIIS